MQYSPKLKKVMAEIDEVLKKHDVAAFVVLHTPPFIEYVNRISPSYSCAVVENGQIRVRLKSAEVGKEKAKQLAEDTYNMVSNMAEIIALHAKMYMDLEEILKETWGGSSEDGGHHSSHEEQNN